MGIVCDGIINYARRRCTKSAPAAKLPLSPRHECQVAAVSFEWQCSEGSGEDLKFFKIKKIVVKDLFLASDKKSVVTGGPPWIRTSGWCRPPRSPPPPCRPRRRRAGGGPRGGTAATSTTRRPSPPASRRRPPGSSPPRTSSPRSQSRDG